MEDLEKNLKIEKGKIYTYEDIKKIFEKAMMKTVSKPFGNTSKLAAENEEIKKAIEDPIFLLSEMLSATVTLHEMRKNMFEGEENKNENTDS